MRNIIYIFTILMIAFIGADRINFFPDSFEYFIFTPFILTALIFNSFVFIFHIDKLNFDWFERISIIFMLYSLTLIISIFFSIDIYLSLKRFTLILFIVITSLTMLSYYSTNQLVDILVKSSILGSIIFYLFNFILALNWFSYLDINPSMIDFEPDEIAYFVPRFGGYCSDVNRGTVILLFFTYIIYFFADKNKLIKIILFMNSIFVLFSFSRTVYLMIFMVFLFYFFNNKQKDRLKLIKYLSFLFSIFITITFLLHFYEYINIELTVKERLDIFDFSRFSSSGIHIKLIIEGIITAFNDIKILFLGSGHGTSYMLIDGYYWSGSKYGNYHSMYITSLVESGLFNSLFLLLFTFIVPLYSNNKNFLIPIIFGLFFFNVFYQLNSEPIFWFIIFLFYKFNFNLKNE